MNNIMPLLGLRPEELVEQHIRPMEVRPERRLALGLRWLVGYARKRGERTMKRLAGNNRRNKQ